MMISHDRTCSQVQEEKTFVDVQLKNKYVKKLKTFWTIVEKMYDIVLEN